MDYLSINKTLWDSRTDVHIDSKFYDVAGFLAGRNTLNDIELQLLGDVSGKSILHLQCHFGLDTLSLARLGAKVTGVDFSEKAIAKANELTLKIGADAKFICSDVYDLGEDIPEKFDIVFTSYGTIGWLPYLDKWARIISGGLRPGGLFVFAEFHPLVWMFDNDFEKIVYSYFKTHPIIETEEGTYADKQADLHHRSVSWNHSISEVLQALLKNGMEIKAFEEYDYSPYNCFNNMVESDEGKYRIKNFDDRLPLVYALSAIKK